MPVVWKLLQDVLGRNPPPKFQQKEALRQVCEYRVETRDDFLRNDATGKDMIGTRSECQLFGNYYKMF